MNGRTYYPVLLFIVINFLAILGMFPDFTGRVYITELFASFLFLILAAITLFLLSRKSAMAWAFTVFFFSLNLMNGVYMFFFTTSTLLVIYTASSLMGFIMSVYNTDPVAKKHLAQRFTKKKPKIVIEDLEPKKTAKKTTRKKSTKKKAKKSKKKTARKKKKR